MQVGEANGKPTLAVISSQCNIGDLSIKEHGGPRYCRFLGSGSHWAAITDALAGVPFFARSWLYNFFLKVLHNAIKNAAEKAVGSAIQSLLNDVRCIQLASILFDVHDPPPNSWLLCEQNRTHAHTRTRTHAHNRVATEPCRRFPSRSSSAALLRWTTRWCRDRRSAPTT